MHITHLIPEASRQCVQWRQAGHTIALVPTMGNLHRGHLALVQQAKTLADKVVVTIFVNPLQFGPQEDLDRYPRTFAADVAQLAEIEIDMLFAPEANAIYPHGSANHTLVRVPGLSDRHCGVTRPQFFGGVTTVVNKLFNIIQADVAVFGEKDYQQLLCIRQMVQDLCLPITIHSTPIQRDADGLALSSRNQYLSAAEHKKSTLLYQTLNEMRSLLLNNHQHHFNTLEKKAIATLTEAGFNVDYFTIAERNTLLPATSIDTHLIILVAAFLGNTRLIDNVLLDLNK